MIRPSLADYFLDPVLQAPTFASIFMCLSSAIIGVLVFLRKRSLLGEALSHAAYPGVVISAVISAPFFSLGSDQAALVTLVAALFTACLGLFVIVKMEGRGSVKEDTALCFVIAIFFGVGVLLASRVQFISPLWYKSVQVFLYGQAATMVGVHVWIYALLALLISSLLFLFFHPIRMVLFDPHYAKSQPMAASVIEAGMLACLALAIIIGIRSVGVVLMAGMLIAPAAAACQLSHRLRGVFIWAGWIGAFSGFLGNYLSIEIPFWISGSTAVNFSLPTGPMILLSSGGLCVLALLFSPRKGLVCRQWRIWRFRRQCIEENMLKYLWRSEKAMTLVAMAHAQGLSHWRCSLVVSSLCRAGWVRKISPRAIELTAEGRLRGAKVVRLHRLWEVYLVSLGQGVGKVHASAEEMEHILNADLELQLAELLGNPHNDPHLQPIPAKEQTL